MNLRPQHLCLVILTILALAGCTGNPTPQVVSFAPSVTPGAKVPTRVPTTAPNITDTPVPSETPLPTNSPTPATPVAEAVREIPVRGGPNSSYPVVTSVPTGNQLPIIGISEDGNWYQITLPDGSKGWVTAASALVTTYGDVRGVPVALAPTNTPTDTDTPSPTPTNTPTSTNTPTATATDTPTNTPTATATDTPSDTPTSTPSDIPTSPPIVTPASTPLPNGLPASISTADFQTSLGELGVASDNGSLADHLDTYTVDLTGEDDLFRWHSFAGKYTDFVASTTIQWGPGGDDDYCGFRIRGTNGTDMYLVHIDRTGQLLFEALVNNEWQPILQADGSAILPGADQKNNFLVVVVGDIFTVYVNGHNSGEFQESTLKSGDVAVMAGTYKSSDKSNCTFTNTQVWQLIDPPTPVQSTPQPVGLPSSISTGDFQTELNQLGVASDNGSLGAQLDKQVVDLTGQDNVIQWVSMDGTYTDFVATADIAWGPGAVDDYCGIRFRGSDVDSMYIADIDRNGHLWFEAKINGNWQDAKQGDGSAILVNSSQSNEMVVVGVGDTFTIYVNGQNAGQFQESSLKEGDVAVLAGTYASSDKSNCTFTNSEVWSLTQPIGAVATGASISYGDTVQGTISNNAYGVRYNFEGQAGDVVNITMVRTSGDLDSLLILLDPNGNEVTAGDDIAGVNTRDATIDNTTLSVTGTYTVVATRFQQDVGLTSGGYTLDLERSN